METVLKIALAIAAIFAVVVVGSFLFHVVVTILQWALVAAVVLGIGYVAVNVISPRKALFSRRRILP